MTKTIKEFFAKRKKLSYEARLPYNAVVENHYKEGYFSIEVGGHLMLVPHKDQNRVIYFGSFGKEHLQDALRKILDKELDVVYDNIRGGIKDVPSWIFWKIGQ